MESIKQLEGLLEGLKSDRIAGLILAWIDIDGKICMHSNAHHGNLVTMLGILELVRKELLRRVGEPAVREDIDEFVSCPEHPSAEEFAGGQGRL